MAPKWLPLESNPEVMNRFLISLGVDPGWKLVDVFGLDPGLLAFVPQPVCALLLLYPITPVTEKHREEEKLKIEKDGQTVAESLYYTKQTVSNACGTVGIIHAVANNLDKIKVGDGYLHQFLNKTNTLDPIEKAKALETDEGITQSHEETAAKGQTQCPSLEDKVDLHFIALVHKDGHLYELDGRKEFPINHGKTSNDTFLTDAAAVCQEFMNRDPSQVKFNIVALTGGEVFM